MKGFDDKIAYFVHSLPATYLLAGPCGVLLFAVRSDRTQVTVQGDRWREKFSLGRFFTIFRREGLGNPPRVGRAVEKDPRVVGKRTAQSRWRSRQRVIGHRTHRLCRRLFK